MQVLVTLCFVAAVAQAIDLDDVDWTKVKPRDITPSYIPKIQDNWDEALSVPGRIVNGVEATPGQFPYQIGLFASTPAGTGFCGGSIIYEKWVVTAAHCVDDATNVTLVFAAQNIIETNPEQFALAAIRIIVHEDWDSSSITDDIALLELAEELTWSDLVQPIRMPSLCEANETFAGLTGLVSGWGRDSDSATGVSPVLRWTDNPILPNTRCTIFWPGMVSNSQICLSGANGRAPCNGDSGGPLVVQGTDGKPTLVGVVSFGLRFGCALGWPSVFTRITSYMDWIETETGIQQECE